MILAVDDDAPVRSLISDALSLSDHTVVQAADVREALAKLRRRRFDLVILDIQMPGATGYDFLEAIGRMPSRAATPVIVLTAHHDPAGVLKESSLGAVDHLTKPFMIVELEAAVTRALGSGDDVQQRREILIHEAEVYNSVIELVELARESSGRED